ncbi:pyruvate formate lyase family protein [Paenibacillus sp.]|uniref:pyruvate formate lyase family protein n=1 Tax=Paenibacillus sp. TaxID=58172 RepID=UPI0028A7E5C0|nr:pyruvate formate lyase family protein [Paenibacillus sp.]
MTVNRFTMELAFTDAYKKYKDAPIAVREMQCLRTQYPAVFEPIQDHDLFAGRVKLGAIAFSAEDLNGFGYCTSLEEMAAKLDELQLNEAELQTFEELRAFWKTESSRGKFHAQFSEELNRWLNKDDIINDSHIAFPLYRMAGAQMDYEKLIQLGIPGMSQLIEARRNKPDADKQLLAGMLDALDLLSESCSYYESQARALAEEAEDSTRKAELIQIADVLQRNREHAPSTMREAIQLLWVYSLMTGVRNYGRMDIYLGDLYVNDLDNGRLTDSEALKLLQSFWQLIADKKTTFNGRVMIGGRGRRNEANADKFSMLALEATRTVLEIEPQLSLRFYKGMNPMLMNKGLEVIGEGRTFPILYNDDVNLPALQQAFKLERDEVEKYCPYGCGEIVLEHCSFGAPNGTLNLLKALEVTLRNGMDKITGEGIGLATGNIASFETFNQLMDAYCEQLTHFIELLADVQALEYQFAGETASYLYLSMLYDDCIERSKGIFAGGIRYLGGTLETYGTVNAADSLTAIREIVYKQKHFSLEKLVQILDCNFEGYEREQRLLLNAPKYGNDNEIADQITSDLHNFLSETIQRQNDRVGLHSYLNVMINNHMNTVFGRLTAASADGRPDFKTMANANNPFGGADKNGVTAFLNSLAKLSPVHHAGTVQNMKFGKELFIKHRDKLRALLDTYFDNGGTQAMITVVNRNDLQNAMREPEKYPHLFVRVGGFSARFVELPKDEQEEILSRTLY